MESKRIKISSSWFDDERFSVIKRLASLSLDAFENSDLERAKSLTESIFMVSTAPSKLLETNRQNFSEVIE